ncbi:RxLR effector protein [Phytophthora megakarya]|uniref:RxLR effector protein n=1 Tax=Phytophthora megakarya TaxID=4795 RepID=A0A225W4Y6_9STRA|nr:RxLR effector protein [Phytophthora megakarya]
MIIAKKSDKNFATRLEEVELKHWLTSGKTIDSVFKLLNLNDETGNILKSPAFSTWVSYATMLDKERPYDILLKTLLARYNDQGVAKLVADYPSTPMSEKLEAALLKSWRNDAKSPDDVFKLLSLSKENGVDLLKSVELRPWISYVGSLKKNPDELLLKELKIRNNDRDVANMLVMAKSDWRSKPIASRLENSLQTEWFNERKTAKDIFVLLKPEKDSDLVFDSPVWSTWSSYLTRVNKQNPDEQMYTTLKTQFGEEKLKTMVSKATENPHTKTIADKLQMEIWINDGKTNDDIFKLLKLDKAGEQFYESPMLSTWLSYVKKLTNLKGKPDDLAGISYLEKQFGDANLARILGVEKQKKNTATFKIVRELQNAQFKRWSARNMNIEKLQRMLLRDQSDMPANLRVELDFLDFYKTKGVTGI